jgi:hypothetical protein
MKRELLGWCMYFAVAMVMNLRLTRKNERFFSLTLSPTLNLELLELRTESFK